MARKKWTTDALRLSASSFSTVKEWRTSDPSAYATASRLKLLDELTSHMHKLIDHGKWSEEAVRESAYKFKHKIEWLKAYPSAPQAARRLGIYQEVTAHMDPLGNKKKRCLYAIFVKGTDLAYVGLTGNPARRLRDHLKSERFKKLSDAYGSDSITFEQMSDFVDVDTASRLEGEYLHSLENRGFTLLNVAKTGGVGGYERKWTENEIRKEADKFQLLKDWREKSPLSYTAALKLSLVDKFSSHMVRLREEYWTTETIIENAQNFKHKIRWKEAFPGAVLAARRLGIWDQATSHMTPLSDRNKWTPETVLAEAKKHDQISQWQKKSVGSYEAAKRLEIFDVCTAHMNKRKTVAWTDEMLIQESRKYQDLSEWRRESPNSYSAARRRNFFNEELRVKPQKKTFSDEELAVSASEYETRSSWKEAQPKLYQRAHRRGILDQVCAHMTVLNPVGKWSDKTSVLKDAQNYYTKSVWQKASPGAYEAAKKLGIFDEAVAHMTVVRRSWSVEDVIASTIGHTTVYGWRKAEPKAYAAASRLGILETITAKLQKLNPIGKWSSKESVVKDARKYKTRTEWYKQSAGAYSAAKKKGWFEEAVAHMES